MLGIPTLWEGLTQIYYNHFQEHDAFLPCAANLCTSTYESGPYPSDEFPRTDEPVYILGRMYSALHDTEELKADIYSRIWCTYRRSFASIGNSKHSSDAGWGCMLRCGQMMLAQALIVRHLGRDWRWQPGCNDEKYWKLLCMFQDKKACVYSIHQIASMGECQEKSVGQWFSPNNIAQVLKRISAYDEWSNITIHVAMDNCVSEEELREVGFQNRSASAVNGDTQKSNGQVFSRFVNETPPGKADTENPCEGHVADQTQWQPMLLIVPLRLGMTDFNPVYLEAIKKYLTFPQSVGMIGGKPNHAHYFIGSVGEQLIYLDPHTTQPTYNLDDPEERTAADESYHCRFAGRMNILRIDPSVALGFFCNTEKDFENLCKSLRSLRKNERIFEFMKYRPKIYHFAAGTADRNRKTEKTEDGDSGAEESDIDEKDYELI